MSYTFVETVEELEEFKRLLIENDDDVLYADIETDGLDFILDSILLFQIRFGGANYILDVRQLGLPNLSRVVEILNEKKVTTVFQNVKFDLKFIRAKTGILLDEIFDTMNCEVILNAGRGKMYYGLGELALQYADVFMDKEDRLEFVNYPEDKPFTEKLLNYSALDVAVLEPIYYGQVARVRKDGLEDIIKLEMQLLPVVAEMEFHGINIDQEMWKEINIKVIAEHLELITAFKKTIWNALLKLDFENGLVLADAVAIPAKTKKLRGSLEVVEDISSLGSWFLETYNTNSSYQIKAVFNLLGIEVDNTAEKTLLDHKDDSPIVEQLIEIRGLAKQISSYGQNVLELVHVSTGKIHTEYNTSGTRTGRFSSQKPNMQQVPRKGGYRECFIPSEGYVFVSLDYSQQEYRLAGALSREDAIINAYKSGSDMHTATGAMQSGKSLDEVTAEERHLGKTLNFAILYGSTEYGLKKNLKISLDSAIAIINKFWKGYPKLKAFNDYAGEKIMELGYSMTPMGRRRYNKEKPLFGDSNKHFWWKEGVLKEGRNFIIQGGGADILKLAMVAIHRKNPFGDKMRILLQIHDELLVEAHESVKEAVFNFVKDEMEAAEQPFLGEIPAVVEGEIKERWSK